MPTPTKTMRSKTVPRGKIFTPKVQGKPKQANVPDSAQCAPSGSEAVRQHFRLAGGC